MKRIPIVAQREFLQIARTRSFWITLLIMPAMLVIMPFLTSLMEPSDTDSYFLSDASGKYGAAVEQRIALNNQHGVLSAFAAYASRQGLKSPRPETVWDDGARPFSDDEVRAFLAAGGVDGALREASGVTPETPPFRMPEPDFVLAVLPADVPTDKGPDAFGSAVGRYLAGGADKPKGYKAAAAAIYIPADFGQPGVPVRVWTSGSGNYTLIDAVRRELTSNVRLEAARAAGLDEASALKIQNASAPVAVKAPPRGAGRERMMLQSALPLGIAYFLLVSVFTSGAWLLQGMLEERSNKLLEAVLACVSPNELMYGKLLGIMGVGFSVILVWGGCIFAMTQFIPGPAMDAIRPALGTLNTPWMAVALLFYFVAGYLICATIYLAVGAVSETIADAQGFLVPISMGLFLPFFALGQLISNPDAIAAKVLSWIPVYTPFAMMARMGSGVEMYEVIGTTILVIAFIVVELWLLGRIFRANILRAGQPPKLIELAKSMFKRPAP